MERTGLVTQLRRVQRHHEACKLSVDEISLLDLSNSMRNAFESLEDFELIAGALGERMRLANLVVPKPVKKSFKACEFMFVPMAEMTEVAGGAVGSVVFAKKHHSDDEIRALSAFLKNPSIQRLELSDWVTRECAVVARRNKEGVLERLALSRIQLVKRLANSFGGSHPNGAPSMNRFDEPIKIMFEMNSMGFPLPYLALMNVAQEFLKRTAFFLGE